MNIFLVVMLYAVWSSVFPLGKMLLDHAPPVFLTGIRMTLAGIILLGFMALRRRSQFKISAKEILPLFLLAFFSIYLTNICEFWGLKHLSAAKTCFIYGLSPFIAAILSYIHFKEKINKRKFVGMLIGFTGFLPVLAIQSGSEGLFTIFKFLSWPELAVMGAALFSVYGWVLLRILVKNQTMSPFMANGSSMLLGGLLALFHSLFADSWAPTPVASGSFLPFLQGILLTTLISNIICYNLYGFMLKKFTATFLSFVGLLSPIFASLNSWIILGERPSWVIFLSTAVVSLGLWIVYQAELKQGYIKKAEKEPVQP